MFFNLLTFCVFCCFILFAVVVAVVVVVVVVVAAADVPVLYTVVIFWLNFLWLKITRLVIDKETPEINQFVLLNELTINLNRGHCVTLIDFLPLIKQVSQFLIKGELFFERERGERERGTSFSLFLSLPLSLNTNKSAYLLWPAGIKFLFFPNIEKSPSLFALP